MPRVATPARGSFLQHRFNPGSLSGGYPGTAVEQQVAPCVQPCKLAISRSRWVHSAVACTVPYTRDEFRDHCRSRRTYYSSPRCCCQCETRVAPPYLPRSVSRQKKWRPRSFCARCTAAVDATRCRRTSRRTATPREKLGKVQRCRCGQVPAAASLPSSRDVKEVLDTLSAENKPNMNLVPLSSGAHAVSLSLSAHSHGRGQGKV